MSIDLARMYVEPIAKIYLSPQMIKRPRKTVVHKNPKSYQFVKSDHVENG